MQDRIVMITGANSGIGKAAALRFAIEGYTVIMACRNMALGKKAQKEIIESSQSNQVYLMELDVSSSSSIRRFCAEYKKQYSVLDLLIHNAAYCNHGEKFRLSSDQIELTFATNVFGPYLLTTLLLDCLKNSADPRILNAGSNIIKHFFDPKQQIEFDNLRGELKDSKPHSVYKMYCQSKMALLMLTFKMAEEYKADGIKVNALQINGAKMSKATIEKFTTPWRLVARVQNLFFPPPSKMAHHYFEICTSDKYKHITGALFNDKREIIQSSSRSKQNFTTQVKQIFGSSTYPEYANNQEITERLWALSKQLTREG